MPVLRFPDPRRTGPEGVVAYGGDLHPDTLRLAYSQGIFPWPHRDLPLLWFCPPQRAILEFARLHVPRSLVKVRRNTRLTLTVDTAFDQVIANCRTVPRPGQDGTWITPELESAYVRLHSEGDAHSVEAWDTEGDLVAGLYGVDGGGVFSGESMFHLVPNASKLVLLHLVDHLIARGLPFMDVQQLTPHMAALGAREIPRDDFLKRWAEERRVRRILFPKKSRGA